MKYALAAADQLRSLRIARLPAQLLLYSAGAVVIFSGAKNPAWPLRQTKVSASAIFLCLTFRRTKNVSSSPFSATTACAAASPAPDPKRKADTCSPRGFPKTFSQLQRLAVFGELHGRGDRQFRRIVLGHRIEIGIDEALQAGAVAAATDLSAAGNAAAVIAAIKRIRRIISPSCLRYPITINSSGERHRRQPGPRPSARRRLRPDPGPCGFLRWR